MTDYFWWAVLFIGIVALGYGVFFERVSRWWARQNHPLLPLQEQGVQKHLARFVGSDAFLVVYSLLIVNRSAVTVRGLEAVVFFPFRGKVGNLHQAGGAKKVDLKPGEIALFEIGTELPKDEPLLHTEWETASEDDIKKMRLMSGHSSFHLSLDGARFKSGLGRTPGIDTVWPLHVQFCADDMLPIMVDFDVRPGSPDETLKIVSAAKHKWAARA
jgi:hypothetical protein